MSLKQIIMPQYIEWYGRCVVMRARSVLASVILFIVWCEWMNNNKYNHMEVNIHASHWIEYVLCVLCMYQQSQTTIRKFIVSTTYNTWRYGDWSERSKQHLYVFVIISKITIISGRHTIDTLFVRLLYSNNNIYHSFFYLHRNHSLAHHTQTNKRKYYVWIETVFRQSYPSFHTPVCVIHHSSFSSFFPSCISSW